MLHGHGEARAMLPALLPAKAPTGYVSWKDIQLAVPRTWGQWEGPAALVFRVEMSFAWLAHGEGNNPVLISQWLQCHQSVVTALMPRGALGVGALPWGSMSPPWGEWLFMGCPCQGPASPHPDTGSMQGERALSQQHWFPARHRLSKSFPRHKGDGLALICCFSALPSPLLSLSNSILPPSVPGTLTSCSQPHPYPTHP